MKILSVFYIPSGGVETLVRQRSKSLKSKGIVSHFLYYRPGAGTQNSEDPTFVSNHNPSIKRLIQREQYDVIIVNSDFTFLPRARNLGFQGKLIYEVQGLGSFRQAEATLSAAKPYVDAYVDAVLMPKTPHLIELVHHYFPSKPTFSFHNCLDTKQFAYVHHLSPEKHSIIGWVGRLEENKNWRLFLDICAGLVRFSPQLKFWIFTDDSLNSAAEKAAFHQKAQQLQLLNRITVYSNVPHRKMPVYYSRIGNSGGFLLSTSNVEGFGYAIIEAMACLCPVICSDSDGVKSFVFHNKTGKLFPRNNAQQAIQEAIALFSNPDLKQNIRLNGQKYIQDHFSLEAYAENFANMLKALGFTMPQP